MAFAQTTYQQLIFRNPGVARMWIMGGGNGNGSGALITSPTAMIWLVYGTSFDSGTVTIKYGTNNSTFAVLTTAGISFTANGMASVTPNDCLTGYYRPELTGTAGTASNLTIVCLALEGNDLM